ncbi:hypothetical protein EUX98_g4443 [Antrodiella citrinella]|uniref:Uncharacterized protein n=1 Tax=Antrodiella citrinella TaxID=2447956 RepID=A0A4S4MWT5_9APHY|nr:hypothetical protein EUX98_g4443 [Antrodiella citrinella]
MDEQRKPQTHPGYSPVQPLHPYSLIVVTMRFSILTIFALTAVAASAAPTEQGGFKPREAGEVAALGRPGKLDDRALGSPPGKLDSDIGRPGKLDDRALGNPPGELDSNIGRPGKLDDRAVGSPPGELDSDIGRPGKLDSSSDKLGALPLAGGSSQT